MRNNHIFAAILTCAVLLCICSCKYPSEAQMPRLDMNTDGKIDSLDQLHTNPGLSEYPLASPYNPKDSDNDGIADGPSDPNLFRKARQAKAIWSRNSTHFILRIDALSRSFQNEFTQLMTDAAILTPEQWATGKFENYNGIGDAPAVKGYQVPTDLPGGKNTPISLATIPKKIWNAFGDPDPIAWINNRINNPNLEIVQHGVYHSNNIAQSDWADTEAGKTYSCETCGYSVEELTPYLHLGKQSLLGDYSNPWIQQAGGEFDISPAIDWTNASHPLISYAPPFNTFDTNTLEALSRNGFLAFSASTFEENSPIFSPNGSYQEKFDPFGILHLSEDYQVDPVIPEPFISFADYLDSITQANRVNIWLIEEVVWASRYCNDIERLKPCESGENGINRENNMVDPNRWQMWMTLLDFVNSHGQPMTLGDYALAMAYDNAPTVYNPNQADSNHDGIGDVVDNISLVIEARTPTKKDDVLKTTLRTQLLAAGKGLAKQQICVWMDVNNDSKTEELTAITDDNGVALFEASLSDISQDIACWAFWNGGVVHTSDIILIRIP